MTPEGATIPEGDTEWIGHDFLPFKFATLYRASNEILSDSNVPLRDVIADTMVRETSVKVGKDAFGSAASGTLKGLTAVGNQVKTALPAGRTTVKWDEVVDCVADIEGLGGQATVVWASPDMAKGLRKERENGATGAHLAGSVVSDRLKSSEDAYFESDTVGFRLTYRVAGLAVAEAASVRWIQASAT